MRKKFALRKLGAARAFLLAGLSAAFAAGAFPAVVRSAAAATGRINLESGGRARTAIVVNKLRLKRALRPTIIVIRPANQLNASNFRTRRSIGLEESFKSPNVVFAYPEPADGRWDVAPGGQSRDVVFVRDLIAKLIADGVADPKRIVVIGRGVGAMIALKLACVDSARLSGVIALLGAMPAADSQACQPAGPIATMILAGAADPISPYGGGKANFPEFKEDLASVESTLAIFRKRNGCADKKHTHVYGDRDPKDGSRVAVDHWQHCARPTELVRVEGGGHVLPGGSNAVERGQPVGAHNHDVETPILIHDFLKRAGM